MTLGKNGRLGGPGGGGESKLQILPNIVSALLIEGWRLAKTLQSTSNVVTAHFLLTGRALVSRRVDTYELILMV
jgi:hypothetical protein